MHSNIVTVGVLFSDNVAYGKKANQSGVYKSFTAESAVDGVLEDPTIVTEHCAHPSNNNSQPAWFYMDFDDIHRIINITILNTHNPGDEPLYSTWDKDSLKSNVDVHNLMLELPLLDTDLAFHLKITVE